MKPSDCESLSSSGQPCQQSLGVGAWVPILLWICVAFSHLLDEVSWANVPWHRQMSPSGE